MPISTHYHPTNFKLGAAANDPQVQSDFKSLSTDLNASDLTSAQKDFASLLSDISKAKASAQASQSQSTSPNDAMSALSTALNAGDVDGAKSAFGSLGQAMKAHHRHHHHQAEATSDTDQPEGFSCDADSDPTAIKKDLNALSTALQSGDVTTAQQALIQLQKDDPKLANTSNSSTSSTATVSAVAV